MIVMDTSSLNAGVYLVPHPDARSGRGMAEKVSREPGELHNLLPGPRACSRGFGVERYQEFFGISTV